MNAPLARVRRFVADACTALESHDPADVLRELAAALADAIGARDASAYRYLKDSCELAPIEVPGRISIAERPTFVEARTTMRPVVSDGNAVVVPLGCGKDDPVGFVVCVPQSAPTDEELELLHTLADVGGVLLDQAFEYRQLARIGELKSQFIALASHELRAPVAVIHGMAVTLEMRHDELAPEEAAILRATLLDSTDRLAQLVNQLLDLSRIEAGKVEITRERFGVRSRLQEVVQSVAGVKAGAIELAVDRELETVADPRAFDRIASNLITNAIRHGQPPIRVSAEQKDTHFRLVVEDEGAGVANEFVPHLFESFAHTGGRADSTGLGLAIAQSYANAHGGQLVYEAGRPKGARFELVLPRQD